MKHPAIQLLEDMIRIQSVNPHFGADAQGEMELSRYIESYARQLGLPVIRQPVFDGRDNLIIELKTGHPDSVLLFEAHMDTVSLGSMERPLEPIHRAGRLYGRGACDTKGSLAAMLVALEQCAHQPERLSSDIVLCASVDEEHAYRGLLKFMELDRPVHGAVVGEPTQLKIVASHKGCVRFAIHTHGQAAHSSVPHEGDNAIAQMGKVIDHITGRMASRLARLRDPLCGPATISIGTIRGGKQINIVPESCTIEVDRRIIPGEEPEAVLAALQEELAEAFARSDVRYTVEPLLLDWALNTPHEDPLVACSRQVARTLGLDDEIHGETYGSDASKLQGLKGIPSIVYGPGSIAQAHTREEWVPVDEVVRAAQFYAELAFSFGGRP